MNNYDFDDESQRRFDIRHRINFRNARQVTVMRLVSDSNSEKIVKCFGTTEHQRHLGPDSSSKENWNSAAKIYNPGPCFLAWTLNFTSGKMPSLLRATNQVLDRLKIWQISSKMIFILWEYVCYWKKKKFWLEQKINSQTSFHLNNSTYLNWTHFFFQVTVRIWWFFEVRRLTSPLYDHTADTSNPIP